MHGCAFERSLLRNSSCLCDVKFGRELPALWELNPMLGQALQPPISAPTSVLVYIKEDTWQDQSWGVPWSRCWTWGISLTSYFASAMLLPAPFQAGTHRPAGR